MRGSYVESTQPKVVEGVAGLKKGRKKPPLLYVYRVVTIVLTLARFMMLKASPISSSRTRSPQSGTLLVMRASTDMNSGPRIVLRPAPGDRSLAVLESRPGSCVVISLNPRPDCADRRRLSCQSFKMPFSARLVTELA